jgi:geranylgeranyl reductase family protein
MRASPLTRPDFDAIVAGAGVAGAMAAYHLIQAGLRVLVVEKERLPRYKACGGAIPRSTLARLPFNFETLIRAAPSRVRYTFSRLAPVDLPLPERPVVLVMRSELDAFLLNCSGAEVLEGTAVHRVAEEADHVKVELADRTITARYLVGADGAISTVARSLGLRRRPRLGGSLEAEVPLAGQGGLQDEFGDRAVFCLAAIPWGYAWIFPKGDSLSVGIGRMRTGRADLRPALNREMERLGVPLAGVRFHGHPLPCYQPPRWPFGPDRSGERLSTRRCLLAGDAAGLVDPFIGEGIRYALTSGRLAAEAVARDNLTGYERAIWREIGHSLSMAGFTANTYYRLPWLSYHIGVSNPVAVRQFVDLLNGRASYVGIERRMIAATARWMVGIRD